MTRRSPTAGLDASRVADLLVEFGQRLALGDENPYKARAYHRAAESLRALPCGLDELVREGRLRDLPGVGPALAERIAALHETGTHPTLEALRQEAPAGVLKMLAVPGLRPREAAQIHARLGIASLPDLEEACRQGRLSGQKGLGRGLQERVLQGLALMRDTRGQRLIHRASAFLEAAAAALERARPDLRRIVPAGDVRRGCEIVADLALVAEAETGADPAPEGAREIALHAVERPRYGPALILATGSAAHVRALQDYAAAKGLTLDESGLRRGRRRIPCADEAAVYAALGLPFIPPELREGRGEIERAAAGQLPTLVTEADLRGLLHCHTNRSDGAHTLDQMAEATRQRGYLYLGIADHSRSAGYAGGLSVEEIEAQHAEVDALNAAYAGAFRILKGIESDILPDGSLDYPDEVLGRFDFVVASVHSRFRLDEATQTARLLRAVSNPHTTILGHMTGRMLLRRPGYAVDVETVLEACAAHGVAVEVNANPHRLDLDWRWHERALQLGCMLSINPDAHSTAELDLTRWGVLQARKGGVPRERVLNCLDLAGIAQVLDARRQTPAPAIRARPGSSRRPGSARGRAAPAKRG